MRREICLLLFFLWAFAGLALPRSLEEDLNISLEKKMIEGLSDSGLSFIFYVNISNSSSSPYYLSSYDYRFMVNQKEYFRLSTSLEEGIEIEAEGDTLLSFPLKITYAHLFQIVKGIDKEDKANCYVEGAMTFLDGQEEKGKLHFAFSGEFPILKKPEIEFLSLRIKDLTIGGADLRFETSFKNNNTFELLVDRISYRLHLGEKLVGEGRISGNKNIEKQGEKVFSLPFLLNFFEVGKEVHNMLLQSSVPCRFSGEIEMRTVWGRVKIPFSKSDKVSVSRAS